MTSEQLKAVWIKKDVHDLLKKHAEKNGHKMIGVIEKLIKDNCGQQQD